MVTWSQGGSRLMSSQRLPRSVSWIHPSSNRGPSSAIVQAEGIKSKTQWFSKKVNAFIAVFIPPQPWGWITQVHTNTPTLPPRGQTEESKETLAEGIKGLQPLPAADAAAGSLKPSAMGGLLASDASVSARMWYRQAVQEVVLSWIN